MLLGKTVIYIDNSNIYRGGKDVGWLPEYEKLMRFIQSLGGQIWDVHFFAIEEASGERTATSDFFDYLQRGLGFRLHLYTYGFKTVKCLHCGKASQITIEKGLDVGIATQIMRDFHNNAFDTIILMSANRDHIELIEFLRSTGKKVKLMIWRNTMSQELLDSTNKWGIEVIYLDNQRQHLEKDYRSPKVAEIKPPESVKTSEPPKVAEPPKTQPEFKPISAMTPPVGQEIVVGSNYNNDSNKKEDSLEQDLGTPL